MRPKLVILDRDGVINFDSDTYIKAPEEWHAIPGSLEAIALLNQKKIGVAIASNQSGIARGYYTENTLALIHQKMQTELAVVGGHIDAIFYCPHHPDDHCSCRKPKTRLLSNIQAYFQSALEDMILIGDSLTDIQAATKFGITAYLVKTGNGEKSANQIDPLQTKVFADLFSAVQSLF